MKTADTNENVEKANAEEVEHYNTLSSQVAAAEAAPLVLQPNHDQKFRSAPPETVARCAPPPPGSLPPPNPPGSKVHTYMDKEKQRCTNLF